jgi:hypothetical protein
VGKPRPDDRPLWGHLPGGRIVLLSGQCLGLQPYRGQERPLYYAHEGDGRWTPAAEFRETAKGGAA